MVEFNNGSDDMQIRLRGRYAMFMNGQITAEDLDDEELAQGRLKSSDGTFRGRPPTVVPGEMVAAMRREWIGRAEAKLRAALMETALGGMIEIAKDKQIDPSVRLRAQQEIIQRTMGKVPDKVVLAAEDPVEALFRGILSDPFGLAPHEMTADERAMLS